MVVFQFSLFSVSHYLHFAFISRSLLYVVLAASLFRLPDNLWPAREGRSRKIELNLQRNDVKKPRLRSQNTLVSYEQFVLSFLFLSWDKSDRFHFRLRSDSSAVAVNSAYRSCKFYDSTVCTEYNNLPRALPQGKSGSANRIGFCIILKSKRKSTINKTRIKRPCGPSDVE